MQCSKTLNLFLEHVKWYVSKVSKKFFMQQDKWLVGVFWKQVIFIVTVHKKNEHFAQQIWIFMEIRFPLKPCSQLSDDHDNIALEFTGEMWVWEFS